MVVSIGPPGITPAGLPDLPPGLRAGGLFVVLAANVPFMSRQAANLNEIKYLLVPSTGIEPVTQGNGLKSAD